MTPTVTVSVLCTPDGRVSVDLQMDTGGAELPVYVEFPPAVTEIMKFLEAKYGVGVR